MNKILLSILTLLVFSISGIAQTTKQSKSSLPFIGKRQFTDEAYGTDYIINIKKDGACTINMGTGRGSSDEVIYKGKFKNTIITKNGGGFKFEGYTLILLDDKGRERKDCVKTVRNEIVDCKCYFQINTGNIE